MDRHTEREKSMICLYQELLTHRDLTTIVEDIYLNPLNEVSDFSKTLIFHSVANKERFIGYINNVLDDWTFDRLGYIEQAILLIACTEFDEQMAAAPVIIDEAILLAKKYGDEKAYKLINGVLDRL
ncbi:transcription antitermination factor NusB [Anaerorhabdus sp.]|uniref:transcription antitermination factor NusB n=1 Tax=Anaerorhabdus sp. TaxID=1872524 RepID=UPI002B216D10|nr:transcription antitermination factor NusB [Anaerorhabdus sp.]MEA4874996.1 transcription antitermination factor NusB [Anaerorhabdus sp.]